MDITPGLDPVPRRRKPLYAVLYVQVLFAILVGITLGYVAPETGAAMRPLGDGLSA
jgi:aerobic C4-dicarboxylate transport protein